MSGHSPTPQTWANMPLCVHLCAYRYVSCDPGAQQAIPAHPVTNHAQPCPSRPIGSNRTHRDEAHQTDPGLLNWRQMEVCETPQKFAMKLDRSGGMIYRE